jgi:putative methyltransferase (TIGR04325 family)
MLEKPFPARVKAWLRPIVPDIGIRIARRALGRSSTGTRSVEAAPPPWEYLPEGWQTPDPRLQGWNVPSIAETQKSKWPSFIASLQGPGPLGVSHEAPADSGREDTWAHNLVVSYAYVLTLASRGKNQLSMLDWGGGVGHYYPISKAILPDLELSYTCQDVSLLCQAGRELLPEGRFLDRADACFAERYDFVMAGSSLWCVEDWKSVARRLARAADEYLYITRMMFVRHAESFVVVQRPSPYGYITEYPLWILNEKEFVDHVEGMGMTLVREFIFGWGPHLAGAPEQGFFKGFLFKRSERA